MRFLLLVIALLRALRPWVRYHWVNSRLYDRLMRRVRGWGGFTGTCRPRMLPLYDFARSRGYLR